LEHIIIIIIIIIIIVLCPGIVCWGAESFAYVFAIGVPL